MALHIYLEHKAVSLTFGYGRHLYLVIREEHTSTDQLLNDLEWRQSGHVISGSPVGTFLPTGNLIVDVNGVFNISRDKIDDADTLADRPIFDLTNSLPGGAASWSTLTSYAAGIHGVGYDYEVPDGQSNHTSNSNALTLSILNSMNIDARQLIQPTTGFYGADSDATLLAGALGGIDIYASSALTAGVAILGRDTVNDTLIGTRFGDRFYGEQDAQFDATIDTVSYELSDAGVTLQINHTGSNSHTKASGAGTGGHAEGDLFFGIENFLGSDHDDVIVITRGDQTNILDGGAGNDILNGGEGIDQMLGLEGDNFLIGGSGADYFILGDGNNFIVADTVEDSALIGSFSQGVTALNTIKGLFETGETSGHNESVTGGTGLDIFFGGSGDDDLHGGGGGDFLFGDAGTDFLHGDAGNDFLFGGDDVDNLLGGDGDDTLIGGKGGDQLYGEDGADVFVVGWGYDTIYDADANDRLYLDFATFGNPAGATYDDVGINGIAVLGGFLFRAAWDDPRTQLQSAEHIYDDMAFFAPYTLATNGEYYVQDGDLMSAYDFSSVGRDNLHYSITFEMDGADLEISVYQAWEPVYMGLNENDQMVDSFLKTIITVLDYQTGDLGLNFIDAIDPDATDRVASSYYQGVNTINTNLSMFTNNAEIHSFLVAPEDVSSGGTGEDPEPTNGTEGNNWISGGTSRDIINGLGGNDDLDGLEGNDDLSGGDGEDTLSGQEGNDELDGGAGMDQMDGGAGDDRVHWDASDDLPNVRGGADTDTLVISGGDVPVSFDLAAHEFELAEHSFGITGGAQRDTYNASWQRTDRTIYQDDGSRSETIFDPTNATDTVQIDNNFDTTGAYVSQFGYYDAGGRWAATFNLPGANDYIYNYFDAADQLDYTVGGFDDGRTFLEDTDQGNLNDWTNKYAVNTAAGAADYQYDYYDNGTRSYLEHDQDGVEIYLYQYTFYDASNVADYYYGKYNDGTDYYFDL